MSPAARRGSGLTPPIGMNALAVATLFLSLRGCSPETASPSVGPQPYCVGAFCVTLDAAEITAEAGQCVTIYCSFTTGEGFKPKSMTWFKCETPSGCTEQIFPAKKNSKVPSGFRGRVSLLEPRVRRRNCSITINDLTASDSGRYQFRVELLKDNGEEDGFSFKPKAAVRVKEPSQRPAVAVPRLAAGQRATLTCTAPGLCSGSAPRFAWTWRGRGENDSRVAGDAAAPGAAEDAAAAVQGGHRSTLTFNASAEHHGTRVTCRVSFPGDVATEETVTLNVTYAKEIEVTGSTTAEEGGTLDLACGVESFPPALVAWTKVAAKRVQNGSEANPRGNISTGLQGNTETRQQGASPAATFSISNVTADDAGRYICTAKHLNKTLVKEVNVTVTYMRELAIAGDTTVERGDALNLTCSVDSVPPSRVAWSSPRRRDASPRDEPGAGAGSATLLIRGATPEHSGRYRCTARHPHGNATAYADVLVTNPPRILGGSGCRARSEVLTCVCVSAGPPLPAVTWPMLENLTEYSVVTAVSGHAVSSTATLNATQHGGVGVECLSSSESGRARETLAVATDTSARGEGEHGCESKALHWLEIIVALLVGALLSAFVSCLIARFCRVKQRSFGNLDETLEMATNHERHVGQAVESDRTRRRGERRRAAATTTTVATAALDGDADPEDVAYANLDFSLWKRQRVVDRRREAAAAAAATDYAEIKLAREEREARGGGAEGKEEAAMMGEDEETERGGGGAVEEAHRRVVTLRTVSEAEP